MHTNNNEQQSSVLSLSDDLQQLQHQFNLQSQNILSILDQYSLLKKSLILSDTIDEIFVFSYSILPIALKENELANWIIRIKKSIKYEHEKQLVSDIINIFIHQCQLLFEFLLFKYEDSQIYFQHMGIPLLSPIVIKFLSKCKNYQNHSISVTFQSSKISSELNEYINENFAPYQCRNLNLTIYSFIYNNKGAFDIQWNHHYQLYPIPDDHSDSIIQPTPKKRKIISSNKILNISTKHLLQRLLKNDVVIYKTKATKIKSIDREKSSITLLLQTHDQIKEKTIKINNNNSNMISCNRIKLERQTIIKSRKINMALKSFNLQLFLVTGQGSCLYECLEQFYIFNGNLKIKLIQIQKNSFHWYLSNQNWLKKYSYFSNKSDDFFFNEYHKQIKSYTKMMDVLLMVMSIKYQVAVVIFHWHPQKQKIFKYCSYNIKFFKNIMNLLFDETRLHYDLLVSPVSYSIPDFSTFPGDFQSPIFNSSQMKKFNIQLIEKNYNHISIMCICGSLMKFIKNIHGYEIYCHFCNKYSKQTIKYLSCCSNSPERIKLFHGFHRKSNEGISAGTLPFSFSIASAGFHICSLCVNKLFNVKSRKDLRYQYAINEFSRHNFIKLLILAISKQEAEKSIENKINSLINSM